jgi:hypothetical protein
MVPSRDQCVPHSERTDALLQRSRQPQSRIGHAKSDCPLHQAREASSLLAIHRARHTASLAILRVLCCDHQALSDSQQLIRHRRVRLPPCFALRSSPRPRELNLLLVSLSQPHPPGVAAVLVDELDRMPFDSCGRSYRSRLDGSGYDYCCHAFWPNLGLTTAQRNIFLEISGDVVERAL